MSGPRESREHQALAVAAKLAAQLGMDCGDARVLKDSNNTVIHLAPVPVVAKVGTTTLRQDAASVLTTEVEIAHYLANRGAPIAPPTAEVPPGPHMEDGFVITLWAYVEHNPHARPSNAALGGMLQSFHQAFSDYPGDLPDFLTNLSNARRVLEEARRIPALSDRDRKFLVDVATTIEDTLTAKDVCRHPLHGDPHLDGNVLHSSRGPLLIDFEAACRGPHEWDLTSLESARGAYSDVDPELLELLSRMRSLCVSTWCWMQYGRAPEVDEAAHVHLGFLRNNARHGGG